MTISANMKVWACRRYGGPDILSLEQRPIPSPKPDEVLVRVHATTVSSGDARIRAMRLPPGFNAIGRLVLGLTGPRQPVLGSEASGTVMQVGHRVQAFRPGDQVIAFRDIKMGCHAEYIVMRDRALIIKKPERLDFAQAASLCFGGTTALDYLRKAELKKGERLLVMGASGTVGSAFVQLAKHAGAHVTALTSTGNVALAQLLGADVVIDYKRQDFTALGHRWDVIADTVAASCFRDCLPVLNERGRYLAIAGGLMDMFARKNGTKRSIAGPAGGTMADLMALTQLAENGDFKPLIDQIFAFSAMREAHARVDTGRKRGAVVVECNTVEER